MFSSSLYLLAEMATIPHLLCLVLTIIAPLNGMTLLDIVPPSPWETALMARYVVHNTDWVSISTISTLPSTKSYPFLSLESMSDGPENNGTGVPYLYMTVLDIAAQDIEKDNRCTILASLAESDYCKTKDFDPQDPRCARVMISGHLLKVNNKTQEYNFAEDALFSRHPAMKNWPKDHNFFVAKLDIEQIVLFDYFGGFKFVNPEDYFKANANIVIKE